MKKLLLYFIVIFMPLSLMAQEGFSAEELVKNKFVIKLYYQALGCTSNSDAPGVNAAFNIHKKSKELRAPIVLGVSDVLDESKVNRFEFKRAGKGYYRIKSVHSGLYLTISKGKQELGNIIVQDSLLKGSDSQLFKLKFIKQNRATRFNFANGYRIFSTKGFALGMKTSSRNWGTNIRLSKGKATKTYAPIWYFVIAND